MKNKAPSKRFVLKSIAFSSALIAGATLAFAHPSLDEVIRLASEAGAFDVPTHPRLEKREVDEAESIKATVASMFQVQMATERQSRDAHAKGHACVQAEFTIHSDIPAEFQRGLFAQPGRKLEALVRFSNGSGTTKADRLPDGRGMAVKLMGAVEGKNLLGTGSTQDFLMINSPRFFIRSAKDYALFNTSILKDQKPDRFFLERAIREALAEAGLTQTEDLSSETVIAPLMLGVSKLGSDPNVLKEMVFQVLPELSLEQKANAFQALAMKAKAMQKKEAPLELRIVLEISRQVNSMLGESYFSMASYLLRSRNSVEQDTAVKYVSRPVACSSGDALESEETSSTVSETALREDLRSKLATSDRCFDFYLQPVPSGISSDRRVQLVEDPRLDFGTEEVRVARLRIPAQKVGSPQRTQYCENLSFNPWQAHPDHQPLGALNRARKAAVTASSIRRHLVNAAERQEPTSVEAFNALD